MFNEMSGPIKFIIITMIIVPLIAVLLTLKYHTQKPKHGAVHKVGFGQYAMWLVLIGVGIGLCFNYERINSGIENVDLVLVIIIGYYALFALMIGFAASLIIDALRDFFPFTAGRNDAPILSSYGLLESPMLGIAKDNIIEGYRCHFFANTNGRNMIFVELGRNTKLHVVAIGDKSQIASRLHMLSSGKTLTKVDLEGDFPKYFSMYCTPEYEIELLHLFDPSDMAYFVDFCRAYDFEIYHDALYVAKAATSRDENDTTNMFEDVATFLERNKRWLDKVGASVHQKHIKG